MCVTHPILRSFVTKAERRSTKRLYVVRSSHAMTACFSFSLAEGHTVLAVSLDVTCHSTWDFHGKVHAVEGTFFEGVHSIRNDFTLIISPFTH